MGKRQAADVLNALLLLPLLLCVYVCVHGFSTIAQHLYTRALLWRLCHQTSYFV
jgi:hypothetical protein